MRFTLDILRHPKAPEWELVEEADETEGEYVSHDNLTTEIDDEVDDYVEACRTPPFGFRMSGPTRAGFEKLVTDLEG